MQTATVTPIRRTVRVATSERWQKALARAIEQGIVIRIEASTGMAIATSGSDNKVCYVTDGATCSCQAGANGDPVCKHRAAYWHEVGMLDPEPPTPAAPAQAVCPDCLGAKYIRIYRSGHLNDWVAGSCLRCQSTGQVPAAA